LRIDPKSIVTFAHDSSPDAVKLHKLCVDYRSAVRRVEKAKNVELINRLYGNPESSYVGLIDDSETPDDAKSPPGRIPVTVMRILRDPKKIRSLKELYEYKCQICSQRLESPLFNGSDRAYAEVHHLRPLGGEHAGLDNWDNMLVLCPNCHVLFDSLALAIHPQTGQVVAFKNKSASSCDKSRFLGKHQLDPENVAFHWERFKWAQDSGKGTSGE
jgi:predicted restriction endonuclease